MPKSIIRRQSLIENKNAHRLAKTHYYLVYIADDEGNLTPALFTQNEISKALLRAENNPEDAPLVKKSWWIKLLKALGIC